MSENKSATIDGIEVEYKVLHRVSNDFEIEITKPFQNISGGLHIPYFARAHHSFDGKSGDEQILYVLNNVYGLSSYIAENRIRLKKQVRLLDRRLEKLSAHSISGDEFMAIRRKSRRLLRKGEISDKYHQMILRWWKKQMDWLWLETELHYIDPFFKNNFPMTVPHDTRKQVLKVLRSEISLQVEIDE